MESCLLCLEINKDILDSIKTNSVRWQELNIKKVVEKYFWPLNSIQPSSSICLSCWQEVYDFHKFYMRIEETHMNFGQIKVEDGMDCNQQLTIQKTSINSASKAQEEDNIAFCFLEPEILIDQLQPQDLTESEILIEQPQSEILIVNKNSSVTEALDDIDLYDMPLKQACKRLRQQQIELVSENPLKKSPAN